MGNEILQGTQRQGNWISDTMWNWDDPGKTIRNTRFSYASGSDHQAGAAGEQEETLTWKELVSEPVAGQEAQGPGILNRLRAHIDIEVVSEYESVCKSKEELYFP